MVARILGSRLAKGKSPFGLLNIQLYQLAEAEAERQHHAVDGSSVERVFNDVTTGANRCACSLLVYGSSSRFRLALSMLAMKRFHFLLFLVTTLSCGSQLRGFASEYEGA
jgi:hypothetical protein